MQPRSVVSFFEPYSLKAVIKNKITGGSLKTRNLQTSPRYLSRLISRLPGLVLCSILVSSPCFAHKVRIFAWGEGDTIYTESKFSKGRPAKNAIVTITNNSTGEELLQGTTDLQGLFQFKKPDVAIAEIDIVVNSGDGHKNHWLYQLEEAADSVSKPEPINIPPAATDTNTTAAVNLTEEQFTRIINESLEKKLAPIRRQLAEESEQNPDVKDILGGIGYILGLAGIAAYMKSKK